LIKKHDKKLLENNKKDWKDNKCSNDSNRKKLKQNKKRGLRNNKEINKK